MESIARWQTIFVEDTRQRDQDVASLLPMAAAAVRNGRSIQAQFPNLWQKLLVNQQLRETFFELLQLVNRQGQWQAASFDPTLLHQIAPVPQVFLFSADNWHIQWFQPQAQLSHLLNVPDRWAQSILLFNSVVELEVGQLVVFLRVATSRMSEVHPVLQINHPTQLPLHTTLQWGDYKTTVPITNHRAIFAPVQSKMIGSGSTITAPLQLTIGVDE